MSGEKKGQQSISLTPEPFVFLSFVVLSRFSASQEAKPLCNDRYPLPFSPMGSYCEGKSTMQKRLLQGGLVFLSFTTLILLVELVRRQPSPGVTRDNFERLHEEMTEKEVEAIMGSPGEHGIDFLGGHTTLWRGQDCVVHITFVGEHASTGRLFGPNYLILHLREKPETPEAPFTTLRRWIGL
jgi:hypothetical protein